MHQLPGRSGDAQRHPRKLNPSASTADALAFAEDVLFPLFTAQATPELYRQALRLRERYQLSFYDSLIVAAALESKCTRLLTEDLQHGQEIEGLRIENPFLVPAP